MTEAANKVYFGLDNVRIAFMTGETTWGDFEDDPDYGNVNLSISAEGDQDNFYASNKAFYTTNSNAGYTGDLEVANMPSATIAKALGWKIDKYGGLVEISDGVPTPLALAFRVQGDQKPRATVLYKVTFNRPDEGWQTTEDGTEVTTMTIPYTAVPVVINDEKLVKYTLENTADAATKYASFFTSVQMPEYETDTPASDPEDGGE